MGLSADSSNYLNLGDLSVTGYPFTLTGWFRVPNVAQFMTLLRVANTSTASYHTLSCHGQVNHEASVVSRVGTSSIARSSASMIPGQWHQLAGVFASSSSRKIYLDGGNMVENTDAKEFDGANLFFAGHTAASPQVDFAEIAILNGILTEEEIQMLALGISITALPDLSRVLAFHDCVNRENRPGWGPAAWCLGTKSVTDHPRVYRAQGGRSAIQPYRIQGPYGAEEAGLHSTTSVVSQPSSSACEELLLERIAAGAASTGIAHKGEVIANAGCK